MLSEAKHLACELQKEILHFVQNDNQVLKDCNLNKERKYLYGPVPSRRLGRSLGVDIVPAKVCTLDCIYCQVGKTTNKTIERKEYLPAKLIIDELSQALAHGLEADYITLAGSGEPTLNSELGKIIDEVSYTPSWHTSTIKRDGGWTLERIYPGNSCALAGHWTSATDPSGGTPGRQNSVFNTQSDLEGPRLQP